METLLDAVNFDMISSSHNGMACQLVSQNLFDIVNQPTMFQYTLAQSDFENFFVSSSLRSEQNSV
ncbi:MAG: hypothetical protein MJE68_22510, partial [Proteobacteria bacterium]|nr:hypothetical protein [Pseudomonadota bacterium]